MTERSEKELQEFINHKMSIDYRDEEVQKKTIIAQDMGANITLYDWIHRYDSPEPVQLLSIEELDKLLIEEFRSTFIEEMNNG